MDLLCRRLQGQHGMVYVGTSIYSDLNQFSDSVSAVGFLLFVPLIYGLQVWVPRAQEFFVGLFFLCSAVHRV